MYGGGRMDRGTLASIALRYDTALSRAMLRALGVPPAALRRIVGRVSREDRRYDGIAWCFANHGSPMDAR